MPWKFVTLSLCWATVCIIAAQANAADDLLTLGDRNLGVTLDKGRNYAMRSIWVEGTEFRSGGKFPCFILFDQQGKEEPYAASDTRWRVVEARTTDGAKITYSCSGFTIDVVYAVGKDRITLSAMPTAEGALKVRAITEESSLVCIPSNVAGAEASGFVLRPFNSGEVIRFPASREVKTDRRPQDWFYHATFVGLGYNGRGLIVRCPQYGAVWNVGTGNVDGVYSLLGGLTADYRPRRDTPGPYPFWNLPLVEPRIDIVFVPVGDTNQDGAFNWVDIGVAYRQKFIRRNKLLDKTELVSISGKLDMWEVHPNYSELFEQIRAVDWAPQRWWLLGAHVPVGNEFTYPCYSDAPHPCHNGPGGYDYFRFKRDCAEHGVKIGLHEMFQDVCPLNTREWGRVPIRVQEDGEQVRSWSGKTPGEVGFDYSNALAPLVQDGSFFRSLDQHFTDWDIQMGDCWHWDCFTAFPGRSDFSPLHPITHGADIRTRIKILQYIQGKGVYFGSEGLQEGLAEHCCFAWDAQTQPGWKSGFAAGEQVPLVPVLFQGMTYYYASGHLVWNLLYGGKSSYEANSLHRDSVKNCYYGNTLFWGLVADRTVKNMMKTDKGWRVEYTEGGSLTVDLANMTPAMTFVLEIDDQKYTPATPLTSPWGVKARLIRSPGQECPAGEYELIYPPGWQKP